MTKNEVREILAPILDREEPTLDVPTQPQWDVLRQRFETDFSEDFIYFVELMSEFSFPGDILNVSSDVDTNGNDTIELTYDYEVANGNWNRDLIPFYGIGNGDYFCLSAKEGKFSAVYYFYHEDARVVKEHDNFETWIKALPRFLD